MFIYNRIIIISLCSIAGLNDNKILNIVYTYLYNFIDAIEHDYAFEKTDEIPVHVCLYVFLSENR